MIHEYSLRLLQKAIQKALQLDSLSVGKISRLEGKVLEVIVSPLRIHFYMTFEAHTIQLHAHHAGPVHTVIHSTPIGLIRLSLLPASKARSLFNNEIKITGDILLGQEVKKLFDELQIDWEGHLAQFTGDVVAHQIGSFARLGFSLKEKFQQSLKHQISEYVHEEAQLFPTEEELNDFMNDIDEIVLKLERLEAHLNHYLGQYAENKTNS